jgi:DNA primase
MPISWEDVGHVYPTELTIASVPDHVAEHGDLWADVLPTRQDLAKLVRSPRRLPAIA